MSVPKYIFSKAWLKRAIRVPVNKTARVKRRLSLEEYSHYGIMWIPGNERVRQRLLEWIEALTDVVKQGGDIEVPPFVFSKEWREGNFIFRTNDVIRGEDRDSLAQYSDASTMYEPCHRQLQRELRARLVAFDAYSKAK